ncbi:hypothetical protein [Vampirovibrio chlorellavorus]|uniref:hypothetical protein n=1 Tax=Vampirovibrio chlorellavorus TaxID=758823 RepID=UPI0026EE8894|nr:hypothetical protein [Vampirovibrio chlorellavorus]
MELFAQARQYVVPALISFMTVSLLKLGIFVTPVELEQSLRQLENAIRAEYATRQDVEDIKTLLNRLDFQLNKINDRLNHQQE